MIRPRDRLERTSLASPEGESVLARLVDEVADKIEAGETIDWEHYATEWPAHVDELRRLAPTLEAMAELAPGESLPPKAEGASSARSAELQTLGDFRLLREAGRGGMGIVYEAEQISLGRRVALKVLPFAAMMDSRQLQRFKNEARTAATISHPHVVAVYAVGCERGLHYFAMQFIDGRTLAEVIGELAQARSQPTRGEQAAPYDVPQRVAPDVDTGRLCPLSTAAGQGRGYFRRVAELGIQAARALDHAHECGVVHRDIKPSNLLLDHDGKLWVADFGLASTTREGDLTLTGDLLGTLRYMSPEQMRGRPGAVDSRTDIYSLGITLYELIALRQAFPSADRQVLFEQIAEIDPPPLTRFRRDVPTDLQTIIGKAIHKDAGSRYQTAGELADDLQRFLDSKPVRARPTLPHETVAKWVRRRPAWAALIGVCVAACLVVIGLLAWHGRSLSRALADTEQLRQEGLQREAQLRTQLYSADVADAMAKIDRNDVAGAQAILGAYRQPLSGEVDPRGPEWEYIERHSTPAEPLWRAKHHASEVQAVAISPTGRHGASSDRLGVLKVWDPRSGKLLKELQLHEGEARALVFSPDGSRLYSAGQDRMIKVVDTSTWQVVRTRQFAHGRTIYSLALSEDGTRLASAARDDGGIRLWNASDLSLLQEFTPPAGSYDVAFVPGEKELISVHARHILCRWNIADGKLLETRDFGHASSFQEVAITDDGLVFASGTNSLVFCFDLAAGQPREPLPAGNSIHAMAWSSRRGTLLLAGGNGQLCRWDLGAPALSDLRMGWRQGPRGRVMAVAWLPEEQSFVAGSSDGWVGVWETASIPTDWRRNLVTGRGKAGGLAYSADGRWLATAGEAPVRIMNATTGQTRVTLSDANPAPGPLQFAHGDQSLIGLIDNTALGVWDAESGRLLRQIEPRAGTIQQFQVAPDGRTVAIPVSASVAGSAVVFFDLVTGARSRPDLPCKEPPAQFHFPIQTGPALVTFHDGVAELVDLKNPAAARVTADSVYQGAVRLSPDGKTVAFGANLGWHVHLIDATTGLHKQTISLNGKGVARDIAWSPDGRLLAISTTLGAVELWHVPTLRLLYPLNPHLSLLTHAHLVRFSADGRTLVVSQNETNSRGETVVTIFPLGTDTPPSARSFGPWRRGLD
ncbi:MAG: protein kinase [Pirellulaceae bacterium]|nr:protein kinase [Pirellulaceae bacterium]